MRRALAVLVFVGSVAACAGTNPASRALGPRIVDPSRDAGAGVAPVDPARGVVMNAGDLRLLLEELLGVHGALTTQMMRRAASGGDGLQPWIDALAANTAELSGAIGVVYGPDGARAFDQLWSFHTQFFLDYADAVARGDRSGAAEALRGFDDYAADFSSFIGTATGGEAPQDAVARLLRVHIEQLTSGLDAYHDGDLTKALTLEEESHRYLAGIGTTLAGAIASQDPGAFPGPVDGAGVAYCSLVGSRLTSLVDTVVTSTVTRRSGDLSSAWSRALTLNERRALDGIGADLDLDLASVTDVFATDQTPRLADLLLSALDRPTLEQQADVHDFASFGPQLLADESDGTAVPLAVRDAYATAYRLAPASRRS